MSLTETLVGLGLVATVGVIGLQVTILGKSSERRLLQGDALQTQTRQVLQLFSDVESCTRNLRGRSWNTAGQIPLATIVGRDGEPIRLGTPVAYFKVDRVETVQNSTRAVLNVEWFLESAGLIQRKIALRLSETAGGEIIACEGAASELPVSNALTPEQACVAIGGDWDPAGATCSVQRALCLAAGGQFDKTLSPPCSLQNSGLSSRVSVRKGVVRMSAYPELMVRAPGGQGEFAYWVYTGRPALATCGPNEYIEVDTAASAPSNPYGLTFVRGPCSSGVGQCNCPLSEPDGSGCESDLHAVSITITANAATVSLGHGIAPRTGVRARFWNNGSYFSALNLSSKGPRAGYRGSSFDFHYRCVRYR